MKRIKKFESFKHRMPKEISQKEWDEKIRIHGYEPFDKIEMDFYKKLRRENHRPGRKTGRIYEINLKQSSRSENEVINISSQSAFADFETNISTDIEIIKLGDEWYLIYEYTFADAIEAGDYVAELGEDERLFLCDEWEEVLGYLVSITDLNL